MKRTILFLAVAITASLAGCGSPPPARTTTTTTTIERAPAQPVPYSSSETTVDQNGQVLKRTQTYTTQSPATRTETTVEKSVDRH